MEFKKGQEVRGTQEDPTDGGVVVEVNNTKRGVIVWVQHYRDSWIEKYKPSELLK